MAVLDLITIGGVTDVASIGSDPTTGGGAVAPIGSIALWNNGGAGQGYLKLSSGNTGWDRIVTASMALTNPLTTLGDTIYGGTGGTETRLAGNITSAKQFLTQTGTGSVSAAPAWAALASGDIPNNAANTTGTAANVTATSNATIVTLSALSLPTSQLTGSISIANGGTGQTTASAAFNALSPLTTLGDTLYGGASGAGTRLAGNTTAAKQFLTQTGTGSVSAAPAWGALASGDIPNNAANTTGTAANITATSNSTLTTLSALSLPTSQLTGSISIANGGTGQTTAATAFNALSPMTTLGDTIYGGTSGAGTRLAGNTTATRQFLAQTGTGTVSAAPAWGALVSGDIPNNAANTSGTAANVTATTNATITTLSALALPASQLTGTLPIAHGGTNSTTTLNNNRVMVSSAGAIVEAAALTNGQLLIGSSAAAPVAANITQGTTQGVTITNGAGSIALDTVQDIRSSASPTFSGLNLNSTVSTSANYAYSQAQVLTTTATATTIATIATTSDELVVYEAHIVGRRTGGSAGSADDSAVLKRTFVIKNIGGTVTVPLVQSDFTYADQSAWTVAAVVSGTSVNIQVTGAANNNITWTITGITQTV